jgi:hypothetical protein
MVELNTVWTGEMQDLGYKDVQINFVSKKKGGGRNDE